MLPDCEVTLNMNRRRHIMEIRAELQPHSPAEPTRLAKAYYRPSILDYGRATRELEKIDDITEVLPNPDTMSVPHAPLVQDYLHVTSLEAPNDLVAYDFMREILYPFTNINVMAVVEGSEERWKEFGFKRYSDHILWHHLGQRWPEDSWAGEHWSSGELPG